MALQGSLSDFGIAEILQLIGSQAKTGILHIDGKSKVQLYLSSGRVIRVIGGGKGQADGLANRLLRAGVVSREDLGRALREQRKSMDSLGIVLLEMGVIDRKTLREFLDLERRETLFELFRLRVGQYHFESKPPNFAKPDGTPISVEILLMEGFRMLDEWPLIRTKINNTKMVFRVLRSFEDTESDAQTLERILDDAFDEVGGADGKVGGLPRSYRNLLSLIDEKRTVEGLIDVSRMGEFETCKALVSLWNGKFIEPVQLLKAQNNADGLGKTFVRVLINVAVVGVIGAVLLYLPRFRGELRANSDQVGQETAQRLRVNRVLAVGSALEVYRLDTGRYPDDLQDLVKRELLPASALRVGDSDLEYLSVGNDFDLR